MFFWIWNTRVMIEFLKTKNRPFVNNNFIVKQKFKIIYFTIQCKIYLSTNFVNSLFVYWYFITIKNWMKVCINFFWYSERASGIICKFPTANQHLEITVAYYPANPLSQKPYLEYVNPAWKAWATAVMKPFFRCQTLFFSLVH
jgi:hypothetical protein